MRNTRPIVVHIGFPKTGTTSLQKQLFAQHPQIISIGKPLATAVGAEIVDCLTDADATDADVAAVRQKWLAELSKLPDDGGPIVLSNERLTHYRYYRPPFATADRMKRIFGQAKILITIRNQVSLLESYYIHMTKRGRYLPLDEFLASTAAKEIAHLDFYGMAAGYAQRFGAAQIGVFPLEQWIQEPARFAARLADFLRIDPFQTKTLLAGDAENKRKSQRNLAYVALRSKIPVGGIAHAMPRWLVRTFERFLASGAPAKAEIPAQWRDRIAAMHVGSNARLMAEFHLDLVRYGYPLVSADPRIADPESAQYREPQAGSAKRAER